MEPIVLVKPTATVTIAPKGRKTQTPREHLVTLTIKLGASDDRAAAGALAREALAGFAPAAGQPDLRRFEEVSAKSTLPTPHAPKPTQDPKSKRTLAPASGAMISVEGSVTWAGRPTDESIDTARAALVGAGYKITVRELRECSHPECLAEALVEWSRPSDTPPGWHNGLICGKHEYRTCERCSSSYLMSSTNSAGQAPSLRCEVCGGMLVEWGSSKVWHAELVTRVEPVG